MIDAVPSTVRTSNAAKNNRGPIPNFKICIFMEQMLFNTAVAAGLGTSTRVPDCPSLASGMMIHLAN
jgi:hypothetical protein